ncbi:RING-H2 finger protein ATL64-like [Phoenix dactylifera]|uniref:RING-type E3 ubiquitin transferase n=1 Tax=Phoenix dactylifera TaxID=42345 RepID=A0A8B7BFN5_PHODC|nr:RING-H2 finger protein ATL64-like [Phoenix dactylifera]
MDNNSNGDPNPGGGAPPLKGYALSGKIMLTAIVVLFTAVLLIVFLHLYLRWRVLRRSSSARRRRRRRLVFAGEDQIFRSPADRGLAADVLKSLPVFVFSVRGGGEGDEVVECAVCLAEFEEGEKVRSLPRCGHRFHIECIDMWFRSHATCPLCRTAVEAAPPPVNSTISVQVSASEPPPPPPAERSTLASDLCNRCGGEEGIGSSSADLGGTELRIEVPARRGEGFRGSEEELGLGLGLGSPGGPGMKSPGSRILLLRRLLSKDLRPYRGGSSGAEPDLERGEGAEQSSPPSHSPSTPTPPPPPPAAAV